MQSEIIIKFNKDKIANKTNAHLKKQKEFKNFIDLMKHPNIYTDQSHVVAKLNKIIDIKNYKVVPKCEIKEKIINGHEVIRFKHTNFLISYLNLIATDMKVNGLIKNKKLKTLLDNSTIWVNVKNEPAMIKIQSKTDKTYFIAPYNTEDNEDEDEPEIQLKEKKPEIIVESQWVRVRDYT